MIRGMLTTTKQMLLFFGLALLFHANAIAVESANADDGVYRTVTVSSFKDCSAMCRADSQCRGAEAIQADTRYPVIQCMLNNGIGENSPVKLIPPPPLNFNIALADFNAYRASHGLQPVIYNHQLTAASLAHAHDLARRGIISHSGSDGSTHADRVQRQGYKYAIVAENIATGQQSWEEVFKAWQDSPGHNKNLLRPEVTEFGLALVYEPKTKFLTYWAMLVAAPRP